MLCTQRIRAGPDCSLCFRHPSAHEYYDPNDYLGGLQQELDREDLELEVGMVSPLNGGGNGLHPVVPQTVRHIGFFSHSFEYLTMAELWVGVICFTREKGDLFTYSCKPKPTCC